MKINSIKINNYRSIKEIFLTTDSIANKSCYILLGVNETGKSNILKAINLISKGETINYNTDCLKSAQKKKESVSVRLNLGIQNWQFYVDHLSKNGIPLDLAKEIKIKNIESVVVFDFENKRIDQFFIEIDDIKTLGLYFIDGQNAIKLIKEIYQGEEPVTEESIVTLVGAGARILNKEILEKILSEKSTIFDLGIPKIIFWAPNDDKYLINKPVNLNEFATDQSKSIPLRNIFKIAERDDIPYAVSLASQSAENRMELQEDLSRAITEHINLIWSEHNISIRIQIEQDLSCSVYVEDKDDPTPKYAMSQRSDGFRQLVSILLNLSVENKKSILKNQVILLDEPEVHLHPSGVRYLRDEILNIAQNNLVFVSTHSIYMVDRKSLNRHVRVEKCGSVSKGSVTSAYSIDPENPYQEEVLYEALGTSVYEHIKPYMLVFEGRTDKDLFDVFTSKFKSDIKPLDIGSISSESADKMPTYAKFFDNKLVKGFFILDSDQKGKSIKNNMIKDNSSLKNNIFELNDFSAQSKAYFTIEDLLPSEIIIESVNELFSVIIQIDSTKAVLDEVKDKLKSLRKISPNDDLKELKSLITNKVLSDVVKKTNTKQIIQDKYTTFYNFVLSVHAKLKE
ncbi:MAG: AAA family ATPase [bacterium]